MEMNRIFDDKEKVKSFLDTVMKEFKELSEGDRDSILLVFNEWMFKNYETDRISWEMDDHDYIICKGNLATTVISALKKIDEKHKSDE